MWAIWPAIIIFGLVAVVGGFQVYKQTRAYIAARNPLKQGASHHDCPNGDRIAYDHV